MKVIAAVLGAKVSVMETSSAAIMRVEHLQRPRLRDQRQICKTSTSGMPLSVKQMVVLSGALPA